MSRSSTYTMDFFEHQDQARRATRRLVTYFVLAVVLIIFAVYGAVMLISFFSISSSLLIFDWWNPDIFLWVAVGTVAVIVIGSVYKVLMLSEGGEVVARWLGGRLVDPNTSNPQERRLLNVVEEMAIASGTPVPTVFLLEKEEGINAFAAGFTPADAVIAATKGTIELLSRDELQGVIAHEFSHILNGDMRLNIRLMGILNGILVIAMIGYGILRGTGHRGSSSKRDGGGAVLAFGAALLVIGYVGVFFGKLIKSAVSRQREFLADASAVQFTRNPAGIAGALKKIGGLVYGSGIQNPKAEEASHLFFSDGMARAKLDKSRGTAIRVPGKPPVHTASAFNFMATHPPLSERIKRIDSSFDGQFPLVKLGPKEELAVETPTSAAQAEPPAPMAPSTGAAARTIQVIPEELTQVVGKLTQAHLAYAAVLLSQLPSPLTTHVHETSGARAVIFALLLSPHSETRRAQFQLLNQAKDPLVSQETLESSTHIDRCPPQARLPLIDLALPALRNLSPRQYQEFKQLVDQMVQADQKIDLFEYTLCHILQRHLDPYFGKLRPPVVKYRSLEPLARETSLLLSYLAHSGHQKEEEAKEAFEEAAKKLKEGKAKLTFQTQEACDLKTLGRSLDRLTLVSPTLKRSLLQACSTCVSHDNQVTVEEGELLRAVADALDCPTPPLIAGQTLPSPA